VNRRAPIVVAAVAALLVLLAVFFLVLPKMGDVGESRDLLQTEQDREQSLRLQLAQLEEARDQADRVRRQLNRLATEVPPTPDLPSLVRLLENTADQSNVSFMSVTPGNPQVSTTGGYSIVPTQITAAGGFFSVDEFLFRLETLPRALKVMQISVGAGQEGDLQVTLNAEVYTSDVSAGPGSVPGPSETTTITTTTAPPGG
jgi:Tfp pilus assembly protein PilO